MEKLSFFIFGRHGAGPAKPKCPAFSVYKIKHKDIPVAYVLVSQEDPGIVRSYMNRFHFSQPVYVTTTQQESSYLAFEFPTTIIIDKSGFAVFKHIGIARWDDEASVRFLGNLAQDQ